MFPERVSGLYQNGRPEVSGMGVRMFPISASRTLHSFGYTHYGCETGAVAVLHTWGQNLSLHPHLHCIVPAAGYSLSGKWRHIGKYDNYLYPVHQLSAAFVAFPKNRAVRSE